MRIYEQREVICKTCGKPFIGPGNAKYCSNECRPGPQKRKTPATTSTKTNDENVRDVSTVHTIQKEVIPNSDDGKKIESDNRFKGFFYE